MGSLSHHYKFQTKIIHNATDDCPKRPISFSMTGTLVSWFHLKGKTSSSESLKLQAINMQIRVFGVAFRLGVRENSDAIMEVRER